ncbi:MAG: 23S rRNA (guanosine(2251)-2'-O)-methyltransferase RlmB [Leptospirales bacterium]
MEPVSRKKSFKPMSFPPNSNSKSEDQTIQKVAGYHPVSTLVDETGFYKDDIVYVSRMDDGRVEKILRRANKSGIRIKKVSFKELSTLWGEKNHQGIMLLRQGAPSLLEFGFEQMEQNGGIYVALDGVLDPANVGAIARSMVAFGAKGLVIPKKRAAPAGEAAMKSSAGALVKLPVFHVGGIANFLFQARDKDFFVIGTSLQGEVLRSEQAQSTIKDYDKIVLVMGSEEKGLSDLVEKRCDLLWKLPQTSSMDSLNVSVATAIFLYELTKNSL